MNGRYLFELATAFWINLAAGYFLTIPISPTIEEKVIAFIYCIFCSGLAYANRIQQG